MTVELAIQTVELAQTNLLEIQPIDNLQKNNINLFLIYHALN